MLEINQKVTLTVKSQTFTFVGKRVFVPAGTKATIVKVQTLEECGFDPDLDDASEFANITIRPHKFSVVGGEIEKNPNQPGFFRMFASENDLEVVSE